MKTLVRLFVVAVGGAFFMGISAFVAWAAPVLDAVLSTIIYK